MGEIGRRFVHASGVVIPGIYLVGLVSWDELRLLLVAGLVIAIGLEFARLRIGLDWAIYEHLTRPYEADSFAGYGYYMVSIAIVGVIFEPEVAIPGMLMLMIGDPISGYLGRGELRRMKHPIAMAGMFVVGVAVTIPFAVDTIEVVSLAILAAILGAVAGTIADAFKPKIGDLIIDDNLTIPICAAIVLWASYQYLPLVG